MHLLLVRHGESVDNVAGLYAGSRDSQLTNHGALQTRRLGNHLASRRDVIGPITQVFASNLQRAYKTAGAVAKAQRSLTSNVTEPELGCLEVVQLAELREKDFGSSEGKKFGLRTADSSSGTILSDSETFDAMMVRVNRFIDKYLIAVLYKHASEKSAVVIVAHGIILNVLLKALLVRFPADQSVLQSANPSTGTKYFAGWSNTGVLQAEVEKGSRIPEEDSSNGKGPPDTGNASPESARKRPSPCAGSDDERFTFVVQFVNNTDHLVGLKKTRGGIGSAKHDSTQRTVDSFFASTSKKRKAGHD